MNKENESQYFLSISPNKFGIYLFDTKNLKNIYKEEIVINEDCNILDFTTLKKFLDKNIFKIEKLSGNFIENLFLIFEDQKVLNLEMGIKKKNYNILITREYLENSLIEAKDLFRESYPNYEIMHMIIKNYFINDKSSVSFEENIKSDHLALILYPGLHPLSSP